MYRNTQTKPIRKINNFGGFTDGDRCVFLADYFKAKKKILLGMDFGTRIGKYSKSKVENRTTKIAKLRRGKKLLEWLQKKVNLIFILRPKSKDLQKLTIKK
ncbi:MAG: hypothetical protein CM1200mP23_4400 [Nitrososphaerota archaeon]|nr:MAG: hypothetical protein CM1200mP23_4400 [Nitrososphaerota archaeon]